jgi:hypothetical protein
MKWLNELNEWADERIRKNVGQKRRKGNSGNTRGC